MKNSNFIYLLCSLFLIVFICCFEIINVTNEIKSKSDDLIEQNSELVKRNKELTDENFKIKLKINRYERMQPWIPLLEQILNETSKMELDFLAEKLKQKQETYDDN